jgi:hypothetical protein
MGPQTEGGHTLRAHAERNGPGHSDPNSKNASAAHWGNPLGEPPKVSSSQTPLQKQFRQVRRALKELLDAAGLEAS